MPEAPARGYGYRARTDPGNTLGIPPEALTSQDLNNIGQRTTAGGSSSGGTVVSTATLTRASTGLLFYDRFDRADAATWGTDWTLVSAGGSAAIVSNVGRFIPQVANGTRNMLASILAAAQEHVVQSYHKVNSTTVRPGLRSRYNGLDDGAGASSYMLYLDTGTGYQLVKEIANIFTVLGTSALATTTAGVRYGLKLHTKDSFQRAYADGRLLVATADTALDGVAGKPGIRWYNSAGVVEYDDVEDFSCYLNNTVTVNALPAGYRVRLNGILFPSAAGVALCDLAGAMCPLQAIEVLDDTNSVVCTLTPSAGVWGGDVYTFNPVGTLNGLTATPLSPTQIRVEWPELSDATGYIVERHKGDGAWATVATVAASVLTYLQTGLTEGVTRYYRVTAVKGAGTGQPSGAVSATTLTNAPSDFHATTISSGNVVLVWSDASALEVNYQLQRAPGLNGTVFADVGTIIAANGTTKTDTTPVAGTEYRYRVAVINASGQRNYSNEVGVSVPDIGTNITLSGSGVLFRDQFARADGAPGANYNIISGSWAILGNKLRMISQNNVSIEMELAAAAIGGTRKEFHIQYLITRANNKAWFQVNLRQNNGSRTLRYVQTIAADDAGGGQANESQWYQYNSGYNLTAGRVANAAAASGARQRINASVLGTGAPVALRSWVDGVKDNATTDSTAANNINGALGFLIYGQPAGPANTDLDLEDLIVCTKRDVTLAGLPAGFKLRIAGQSSATSDGVNPVTTDILGAQMPIASLEVIDVAGNTIRTVNPVGGIFGGDVYAIDGAAVPPPPPPTPPTTVDIGIGPLPGTFDGVTVGMTHYFTGTDPLTGSPIIVSHALTGAWQSTPDSVAQDISFSSAVSEVRISHLSVYQAGGTVEAYDALGALLGSAAITNYAQLAGPTFGGVSILTFPGIRTVRINPPAGDVIYITDILFKH